METITHTAIQRSNPMIWAGIPRVKKLITQDIILKNVCDVCEIDPEKLMAKTRTRNVVKARQIAMYLLRKKTSLSLKQIGSFFGGFDHGTIIYSCKTVENLMESDPQYNILVSKIQSSI